MLHWIKNIKIINAQHAKVIYKHKNTKEKILKPMQPYGSIKSVVYMQVVGS